MNVNLGITPQTQAQQDLYRLAYQCVHSYTSVGCTVCPTCAYNIRRYGYDPNEVELIRARAIMDYNNYISNQKSKRKSYWQTELGILLIVIILVLFIVCAFNISEHVSNVPQHPSTIQETTQLVRANIRDVNYDDLINCIDYAVSRQGGGVYVSNRSTRSFPSASNPGENPAHWYL
jgi:hypothetical protein